MPRLSAEELYGEDAPVRLTNQLRNNTDSAVTGCRPKTYGKEKGHNGSHPTVEGAIESSLIRYRQPQAEQPLANLARFRHGLRASLGDMQVDAAQ